jgi:hypothetical protein
MLTELSFLALPLALRGLLRRESRRDFSAGAASPPRGSAPPTFGRSPSDPPPRPEPTSAARPNGKLEWNVSVDPCTHERLVVTSIYSGRIG